MISWAYLPCDILIKIFQYLSYNDRQACNSVCRTWRCAVQEPTVWQYVEIYLDTDMDDVKVLLSTVKYASHITSLHIACTMDLEMRHRLKYRLSTMARRHTDQYLMLLKQYNVTLTTIKLSDWCSSWKYRKVLYHLAKFLQSQRRLKVLDFSNTFINQTDLFKILFACRNSGASVKHLNLLSSFRERNNIFDSIRFRNALQLFSTLETLKINYSLLSVEILASLIGNGNTSLRLMEICVTDTDSCAHTIQTEESNPFVGCYNKLRIIFNIYNICHHSHLKNFLVDKMPLKSLTLTCGHSWDQQQSRQYRDTFQKLIDNYTTTLTHLSLHLRNNREVIDNYLHALITDCRNLEYIEFEGVLNSTEFLQDICNLHRQSENWNFKFLHVRPKNASIKNILELSKLWRDYVKPMAKRNFYFEIEAFNNGPVQIFV